MLLADDGQADGALLILVLWQAHGNTRQPFAISPAGLVEANKIGAWNKQRYRNAILTLRRYGIIRLVYAGGRGPHDPSLYAFTIDT